MPASRRQYVDRVFGKGRIVLLAREPLLLRRRNDPPIAHQARGAVVVESGDAEDVHVRAS